MQLQVLNYASAKKSKKTSNLLTIPWRTLFHSRWREKLFATPKFPGYRNVLMKEQSMVFLALNTLLFHQKLNFIMQNPKPLSWMLPDFYTPCTRQRESNIFFVHQTFFLASILYMKTKQTLIWGKTSPPSRSTTIRQDHQENQGGRLANGVEWPGVTPE